MAPAALHLCGSQPRTDDKSLPWFKVARTEKLRLAKAHLTTSASADSFLDLCLAKLRHHNAAFLRQNDVFAYDLQDLHLPSHPSDDQLLITGGM